MANIKQSRTITVKRSEINFSKYNPKNHTDEQVKQIVKNFKDVAFLGGIVWNENTGNLIDGHKRVMAMDIIHKGEDYDVKVEMIDLSPKQEREQNIFQTKSRTDLSDELMRQLIGEGIDYKAAGLTDFDAELYGAILEQNDMSNVIKTRPDFYSDDEKVQDDRKHEVRDHQDRIKNTKNEDDRGADSYVIIRFPNQKEKQAFMMRAGYQTDEKYIDGPEISERIEFID